MFPLVAALREERDVLDLELVHQFVLQTARSSSIFADPLDVVERNEAQISWHHAMPAIAIHSGTSASTGNFTVAGSAQLHSSNIYGIRGA